jgi:hypothetical protein
MACMAKFLQIFGALALVGLVLCQFMGPEKHNQRVSAVKTIEMQTAMPANVAGILHRACNDCHSQQTVWRWYAGIAPFSWLQIADVDAGRAHLDFSNWTNFTLAQKEDRLKGMCKLTRDGEMPLWYYKPMHPAGWLSDSDRQTVCTWTDGMLAKLQTDPNAAGLSAPPTPGQHPEQPSDQEEHKTGQPAPSEVK